MACENRVVFSSRRTPAERTDPAAGFAGQRRGAGMGRMVGWTAAAVLAPLLGSCGFLGGRVPVETPEAAVVRVAQEDRIRADVRARLAHEPSIDAGHVRVEVVGTDVHLHGTVSGYGALRCAIGTAGLTPGVSLVVDYLVVQPGPAEVVCLAPRVFPRGDS